MTHQAGAAPVTPLGQCELSHSCQLLYSPLLFNNHLFLSQSFVCIWTRRAGPYHGALSWSRMGQAHHINTLQIFVLSDYLLNCFVFFLRHIKNSQKRLRNKGSKQNSKNHFLEELRCIAQKRETYLLGRKLLSACKYGDYGQ